MKKVILLLFLNLFSLCFVFTMAEKSIVSDVNVWSGDTITFGHFEQDDSEDDGKEDIEWIVLYSDKDKHTKYLISRYLLSVRPFCLTDKGVSGYKNCYLRTWLNDDFLNDAFDSKEISMLLEIGDYNDKVTILDVWGAEFYLGCLDSMFKNPTLTPYAIHEARDKYLYVNKKGECDWWLSTQTKETENVYIVSRGQILDSGGYVYNICGVRPVIKIQM